MNDLFVQFRYFVMLFYMWLWYKYLWYYIILYRGVLESLIKRHFPTPSVNSEWLLDEEGSNLSQNNRKRKRGSNFCFQLSNRSLLVQYENVYGNDVQCTRITVLCIVCICCMSLCLLRSTCFNTLRGKSFKGLKFHQSVKNN